MQARATLQTPPTKKQMQSIATPDTDPQQVLQWLLSLDPAHLQVHITIQDTHRSFSEQNWQEIAEFTNTLSPGQTAHFLISRPIHPSQPRTRHLAGAGYFQNHWESFSPSFIKNLLQTDPASLNTISPDPNLHPAKLKEIFPENPPPSSMSETPDEEPIAHELYQPAQVNSPQSAISPEDQNILTVFTWLHRLEPQHLRAEVGIEDRRVTFTSTNWNTIPTFASSALGCLDGSIILYDNRDQTDNTTVAGLQLSDQEWNIIRPDYLRHYISSDEKANFANILDIYPDCPVAPANLLPR
jgi:hypothetical protein